MDARRTLAELAADPDRAEDLPRDDLPAVLSELEALRARLQLRLVRTPARRNGGDPGGEPDTGDRLLDAEAVAERLDVDERYVYDHADGWPFTRRISPRKLRFSERGLYRWLETRRG